MSTSYTSLLGLALPVTGELSGTWGDTVNNSITSLLDTAIAGTTTVSADTTLTTTDGASNQARSAIIIASGHVANITITAPAQSKIYTVINASGTYTVTFRGVGPTTGVTLGVNEKAQLAWNGSDFVRIGGSGGAGVFSSITNSSLTSGRVVYSTTGGLETDSANLTFNGTTLTANTLNLTNALGTTYGGTGLTSFTSGGVVYASSGSALSTGSALTFDGTNLGVGTASPSTYGELAVYRAKTGTVAISVTQQNASTNDGAKLSTYYQTTETSSLKYYWDGSQFQGQLYSYGPLAFTLGSSPSEQMRLTSTGLGIGTSSPAYKLDVLGQIRQQQNIAAGYTAQLLENQASNGYAQFLFNVGANGANGQAQIGYAPGVFFAIGPVANDTTTPIVFRNNNATERARIDSSGNLGIGTSSPGVKLDVNGSGIMARVGGASGNNLLQSYTGSIGAGIWSGGQTRFYTTGAMTFSVNGTLTTSFPTGYTDAMTLDSSGNLGIGTSSPATALQVQRSSANAAFRLSSSGGSGRDWTITSQTDGHLTVGSDLLSGQLDLYAGNLGIGTSSPGAKLDVNGGNANTEVRFNYSDNTPGRTVTLRMASTSNPSYTGAGAYVQAIQGAGVDVYSLAFGTTQSSTSATERMRLDSSGNLGIGTSSPSVKLQVVSASGGTTSRFTNVNTGNFIDFYESNTSTRLGLIGTTDGTNWSIHNDKNGYIGFDTNNTERMRLDSSGNLLVGTTTNYNSAGFAKTVSLYDASSVNISLTNASKQYQIGITGTSLGIYDGTASAYRMYLDTSGNLGIGTTSPTYRVDIDSTNAGGNILSGTRGTSQLVAYQGASSSGYFGMQSNNNLIFITNGTTQATLDTSGNLTVPAMYSTTVTTPRNVFIDSTGKMGGISSTRASKTNIFQLDTASWIYELNPVTFNYRKKDEDNKFLDEFESEQQFGLIAEEVELVKPELCIYTDDKVSGIHYDRMIAPLIKAIQELKASNDALTARITQLESK